MGAENKKKVLLVMHSAILARGLEAIFSNGGEFSVIGTISDLSGDGHSRLKNADVDVLIIEPAVFDLVSRMQVRQFVPSDQTTLIAMRTGLMSEDELRQYDESICIYDSPATIVRKMRSAMTSAQERPKPEGDELSSREKEILVCVAKGMLNKEIADYCNLSIHTVITHRKNISRKTGIKSVAGLTVYALLNKLIEPDGIE